MRINQVFAGKDGRRTAHRLGSWFLACCGSGQAKRFCRDNGIRIMPFNADTGEVRLHEEDVNYKGGYLVPDEFDDLLIDLKELYGVARKIFRRTPMVSDTKSRPRRSGGLTAYWMEEGEAGTESTGSWGNVSLVAKKLMVLTRMSAELSEDAAVDIGQTLANEIAYAFAVKEDDAAFNGDGTSTYGGVYGICPKLKAVDATIGNIKGLTVAAGNTFAEFTLANFDSVVGTLPEYADNPNTVWVAHKVVWGIMCKLMHAVGGNTAEVLAAKLTKTFMGYPVVIAQKMPKTDANSQIAALLGDFTLAADLGDRQQTSIAISGDALVNSESMFERNQIAVRGTERIDINVHDVGDTTDAGPVVGLISAAS